MNRLAGKNALITGGSQGLGRQLAITFVKEGAAGICIVARRSEYLDEVRNRLIEINPKVKVITISADLSRQEDIERVVAITLQDFNGRLDILVNNASTIGPSPMPYLLDYPVEDFKYVINTNLIAPFLLIKKLLPAMIENGGSIVNITSDAGSTGYPGWGAYGISKFGVEGMSQTWASELQGSGVRVNYVDPGNMNTGMHRAAEPDEDPKQWADPAEITEVFVYLASDESENVNGRRFRAQGDNHYDSDSNDKQLTLVSELKKAKEEGEGQGEEEEDDGTFGPLIEQQHSYQQYQQLQSQNRLIVL
jgi:NAD(P)-dependent dehydrogenase (short-subunit alcohol dehydrogenase family)